MSPDSNRCALSLSPLSEVSPDALRLLLILGLGRGARDDAVGDAAKADDAVGDPPAFDELLRDYHKRVYNLIYRLIGDPDDAADLTQETFVRAYRAYPRFRGSASAVYPWLCRIAVNAGKNKLKEASRRSAHEAGSLDEPVGGGDSAERRGHGDESADPLGLVQAQELGATIQGAIQALPPEFRMVVVLRDMNGLSYKEVAEAAGLSLDLVRTRLFRAREMLRRRLSAYLEG